MMTARFREDREGVGRLDLFFTRPRLRSPQRGYDVQVVLNQPGSVNSLRRSGKAIPF